VSQVTFVASIFGGLWSALSNQTEVDEETRANW